MSIIILTGATNSSVTISTTKCVHLARCRGTEQNLTECGSRDGSSSFSSSTTVATVECGEYYYIIAVIIIMTHVHHTGCLNGDVRLKPHSITETESSVTGLVQYCDQHEWRTLCSTDYWMGISAAPSVICRQLGYSQNG